MTKRRLALAVDWGGTKTMVGLVGTDGKVIAADTAPTRSSLGLSTIWADIHALAGVLLEKEGVSVQELTGVGVTVPGMADPARGVLLYAPTHGWRDVPVRTWFREMLPDLEVFVDNDVNAAAWGEYCFGAGKGTDSLLWITVSTGIGGALVLNGAVFRGASGLAGEIGHLVLEEEGPLCGCGQRGCLEALASGPAIVHHVHQQINSGVTTTLRWISGRPLDARDVARAAREGDELARQVMGKVATYLGRGIAIAANLINPELIVLGGGVSQSLDLMLPDIQRIAAERAILTKSGGSLRICCTALGYEAALVGAGALVLNREASSGE